MRLPRGTPGAGIAGDRRVELFGDKEANTKNYKQLSKGVKFAEEGERFGTLLF